MKLNIFSIPLYIANIDVTKINLVSEKFEETWLSETSSSHNFKNTLDTKSINYLLEKIASLLSKDIKGNYKINLTSIWQNNYKENDFQERHTHAGSHFSFIIFKKINESRTVFLNPIEDLITSYYNGSNLNIFDQVYVPECRQGQMILFPSFLGHMVKKTSNASTIAGNINLEIINDNN